VIHALPGRACARVRVFQPRGGAHSLCVLRGGQRPAPAQRHVQRSTRPIHPSPQSAPAPSPCI
jgi:hypothetical protein